MVIVNCPKRKRKTLSVRAETSYEMAKDKYQKYKQFEVKYAIEAVVSAAILEIPAYIEETRDIYREYRSLSA
ncbi:4183_t:CDS:2 [Funneliformis caledonium]|uniref:4183_t:CDS:1 n=1 Tax=Funneliformis caledonium TaxID=1117310 RepID=A0A9N9AVJ0_9GLOM|nr:4183_t:CDS:2 [Funneliformis caledonium]